MNKATVVKEVSDILYKWRFNPDLATEDLALTIVEFLDNIADLRYDPTEEDLKLMQSHGFQLEDGRVVYTPSNPDASWNLPK